MLRHLSSPLLLAIIMLLGVGLVQVYSSSYIFATESYGNGLYFFERQLIFVSLAFVVLLVMAQISFEVVEKWGWMLWVLSALGVVATFIPGLGVKVGGASRWLDLPMGFRFEPSELLKFSTGFLYASILCRKENIFSRFKWYAIALLVVVPLALLLKQPDFGSFAIITVVFIGLLFSFGLRYRWFFAALSVAMPAFFFLVMMVPYRRSRFMAFLDPWADADQKGFQVIQSMLSFSSGGLTGSGLGQGQGKLFFLPEAHTDFTLAVLGEEGGFIGFLILMALYGFVVLRGFQISVKTENRYRRTVALSITMTFALSIFINAGVTMGLLPTKGLTLPFLSYGGSSLLVLAIMFGLLLNIEKRLIDEEQNPLLRSRTKYKVSL